MRIKRASNFILLDVFSIIYNRLSPLFINRRIIIYYKKISCVKNFFWIKNIKLIG